MPYPPGLKTLLCAVCFLISSQLMKAAHPQAVPGVIRVMRLVGTATIQEDGTGTTVALRPGDVLAEHYTLKTGPYSSVVLLFSNGSTLVIKAETELSISKFIQDPFQTNTAYMSQLEAEPSESQTKLKLNYGTLVGKVKPLNTQEGSTYDVATPIGIAGIRGTSFSLSVGKDHGTLQVAEGEMFFLPSLGESDGRYIIAKTETQLFISIQEIKQRPLTPQERDKILEESSQAVQGLATVRTAQFQPGPDNLPNLQEMQAEPSPPFPEKAVKPSPSEDKPALPTPLPAVEEKKTAPYDLPNLDSDSIDDTTLVPFATPPPASPVGGS